MGKYTGKAVTVPFASSVIYQRVSNLSGLQQRLEELPEEQLKAVGDVNFVDDDNFEIQAPGVGKVNFHIVERTPESRVVFQAETGVVPLNLIIDIEPEGDSSSRLQTSIDVEIPMMLRPLVGGKMQEAADKFSEMIAQLNG